MKVLLRDITDEGLDIDETIDAGEIALADEGFKVLSPLEIHAHLEKASLAVLVDVEVKGTFELFCSLCLEPIQETRDEKFDFALDVEPSTEFVELGEDIRQEMFIALTAILYCREDCKGLCKTCGANLNTEKCKCQK